MGLPHSPFPIKTSSCIHLLSQFITSVAAKKQLGDHQAPKESVHKSYTIGNWHCNLCCEHPKYTVTHPWFSMAIRQASCMCHFMLSHSILCGAPKLRLSESFLHTCPQMNSPSLGLKFHFITHLGLHCNIRSTRGHATELFASMIFERWFTM